MHRALRGSTLTLAVLLAIGAASTGCAQFRTGESYLYALHQEPLDGESAGSQPLEARWGICDIGSYALGVRDERVGFGVPVEEGEDFSVILNTAHLEYFDAASGEILIYAEFSDLTGKEVFANRIFRQDEIVQGSRLNFDHLVVMPGMTFRGQPIRFTLTVIELDKEEAKEAQKLIDLASTIGSAAAPQYSILIGVVAEAANALIGLNKDDIELRHSVVFHSPGDLTYRQAESKPFSNTSHAPLATGKYLVVKEEHPDRLVWPDNYADYVWKPVPYLVWHLVTLNFVHKRYGIRGITDAVRPESTRRRPFSAHFEALELQGNELRHRGDGPDFSLVEFLTPVYGRTMAGVLLEYSSGRKYRDKSYLVFEVVKPTYRLEPSLLQAMGEAERKQLDELFASGDSFQGTVERVKALLTTQAEVTTASQSVDALRNLHRGDTAKTTDPAFIAPLLSLFGSDPNALSEKDLAVFGALDRYVTGTLPRTIKARDALKSAAVNPAGVFEVNLARAVRLVVKSAAGVY